MFDIQDYLAENPAFAASFVRAGTAAAGCKSGLNGAMLVEQ